MAAHQFDANFRLSQRLSLAAVVVGAVAKLIRAPIVIVAIGAEHYGLWVTCLQIVGISMSYEYVIGAFVTTHISSASADNTTVRAEEHFRIQALVKSYYRRFIFFVSLFALLALGAVFFVNPPPASILELAIVVSSAIVSCCAYLYFTMYVAVLDGYGNIWVGRLAKLVYEIAGLFLLVGALFLFKSVISVALALIFQTLVFGLVVRVLHDKEVMKRQSPSLTVPLAMDFGAKLRRRAVSLVSTQTATVLYLYSPLFVIPVLADYAAVAGYSVSAQLMMVGIYIITPVLSVYLTKLVHDVNFGQIDDYLGLAFFCCVVIFCMYGLVLTWAKEIIDAWVGPGLYLGAKFIFVLVLISIFEIIYLVLRSIVLCFSDESIFDKLAWRAAVLYITVAIPCFITPSIWKDGLFLVLLPTVITSAFILVRSLYQRIFLDHPHRLLVLGAWAVGGFIAIMLGSVIIEGVFGESAMLARVAVSLLIVAFSVATVVHALGAVGSFRIAAKLLGVSR
jgi:O-antigen/teichoic acid export membrane protein